MKILQYILWLLWKIWFYTLVLVVIIILSPFLMISLSSDKTYKYFFLQARLWAYIVFYGSGFRKKQWNKYGFEKNKSYMICANHTSMMDIMLMLILVDNPFVFVGKAELAKMPIFGSVYKRACILVDRSSKVSRQKTMLEAANKLSNGLSVCIFPEGGVSDDMSILLDEFKDGAFRLAIDFQIPIASFTFIGLRKAFPFKFFAGYPTKVDVIQHPFVSTEGLTQENKLELKQTIREMILKPLVRSENNCFQKINKIEDKAV